MTSDSQYVRPADYQSAIQPTYQSALQAGLQGIMRIAEQ